MIHLNFGEILKFKVSISTDVRIRSSRFGGLTSPRRTRDSSRAISVKKIESRARDRRVNELEASGILSPPSPLGSLVRVRFLFDSLGRNGTRWPRLHLENAITAWPSCTLRLLSWPRTNFLPFDRAWTRQGERRVDGFWPPAAWLPPQVHEWLPQRGYSNGEGGRLPLVSVSRSFALFHGFTIDSPRGRRERVQARRTRSRKFEFGEIRQFGWNLV